MYAVKMADMAREKVDLDEDKMSAPISIDQAKYPFGLCISLSEVELEKLGTDADCDVGDMIMLHAMARVTNKSEREKMGGGTCCNIELQITHLALEGDDSDES